MIAINYHVIEDATYILVQSSAGENYYLITSAVSPGNSDRPVINASKKAIGVATAK